MHATQDAMAFHKLFRYQILKWGSHSGLIISTGVDVELS